MSIFKTYIKISLRKKVQLVVPVVLFVLLVGMYTFSNFTKAPSQEMVKPKILINDTVQDSKSELMVDYLSKSLSIGSIDITDPIKKADKIDEALFYGDIDAYIEIKGDDYDSLIIKESNNAQEVYLVKYKISSFYKYYDSYVSLGYTPEEIKETFETLISQEDSVDFIEVEDTKELNDKRFTMSSQTLAYPLALGIVGIVVSSLSSFGKKDCMRRKEVSSISPLRYNVELLSGVLVVTHAVFLIMMSLIAGAAFMFDDLVSLPYVILNAYLLFISMLAFGFMMSKLLTGDSKITMAKEGIILAFSFLSGIFIPQAFIPSMILNFSKIFPLYWYAIGNQSISEGNYNLVFVIMIQLGFALLFFLSAIYIDKRRSKSIS